MLLKYLETMFVMGDNYKISLSHWAVYNVEYNIKNETVPSNVLLKCVLLIYSTLW